METETFFWQDENDNSGSIRIDVITLSNKPVEIVAVKGMVASGKDKGKLKSLIPAGQWNGEKRDVYFVDEDGSILIGWADSNGAPPLDEVDFKNGIWAPFHLYGPKKTRRRDEKYTYKVGYKYNDNYDPTFDGNEEAVKEKGNPKPTIEYAESDF